MKLSVKWIGAAILITSNLALATDLDELSEDDFLSDAPLVSSATRLKQEKRNIPASITVIDREMIEASSAITIIELLRLVPGFLVSSIDGTESTTTYHGLTSQHNERLQILIDGRSVYDPIFGGALWYSLPVTLDEIERIEVLRGPNAASYGANSFSGVINIKTYGDNQKKGTELSVVGGDRDIERYTVSHRGRKGKTSYRIVAQHESNIGFENSFKDRDPTMKLHDDHLHNQLSIRVDHDSESGATHTFQAGTKKVNYETGFDNEDELTPRNRTAESGFENYIYRKDNGLLDSYRLQLSHNYIDVNNNIVSKPLAALGFNRATLDQSFRDHRYDIEFEHTRILSPELQGVWGLGFRYDVANSDGFLLPGEHKRVSTRAFGHVEWKQNDSLTWNLGGLVEYYEEIGSFFSPRVAVNFHITPNQTIRSSWSQAYRMPSFFAEYANEEIYVLNGPLIDWHSAGNPNLDPEQMTSVEIGYLGYFFERKLELDLRFAKERIDDVIERTKTLTGKDNPSVPRFRYLNFRKATIDSAELQFVFRPRTSTFFRLNVSYANAYGFTTDKLTDDGAPFEIDNNLHENVPIISTGILASHKFDNGWAISTQYHFVDEFTTEGDGDDLETSESIDVKVQKLFDLNGNELSVSATVRNVTDNDYQDFNDENLIGLEAFFQVKLGLY